MAEEAEDIKMSLQEEVIVDTTREGETAPTGPPGGLLPSLHVLWRFSRPHTIYGSMLSIPALAMYAMPVGAGIVSSMTVACGVAFALVPALLLNLYIVGLNQLEDVKIDMVNKPDLPLAAGDMSLRQGRAVVLLSLVVGLGLGFCHPRLSTLPLKLTLLGSAALGTAYSLPPLRLKRFPLLASLSIMAVRGALINWGFFAHASSLAARAVGAPPPLQQLKCAAAVAFYTVFGVVIALTKDVPDVAGDQLYGIRSFSVRAGPRAVLRFAVGLLRANFAAAAIAAALAARAAATPLTCARRCALAAVAIASAWMLGRRARAVDATDARAVYELYMAMWAAFYASYACLPLAR